jgi:PEP-CTERM motif-containing protein
MIVPKLSALVLSWIKETNTMLRDYRIYVFCAVVLSSVFLLVPYASADIIHVENATACTPGGTICAGGSASTTPFSLTAIKAGTEGLLDPLDSSVTVGNNTVPTYLINNDTGVSSFTLTFMGTLASNAFLTCQVTGSEECSITGAGTVGTGGMYGPPSGQTTNWDFYVNVGYTGVPAGNFDLTFASFAHAGVDTGTVTSAPEPSSLALLATGLFGLLGFARRKMNS